MGVTHTFSSDWYRDIWCSLVWLPSAIIYSSVSPLTRNNNKQIVKTDGEVQHVEIKTHMLKSKLKPTNSRNEGRVQNTNTHVYCMVYCTQYTIFAATSTDNSTAVRLLLLLQYFVSYVSTSRACLLQLRIHTLLSVRLDNCDT